jgi:hypothetical protein
MYAMNRGTVLDRASPNKNKKFDGSDFRFADEAPTPHIVVDGEENFDCPFEIGLREGIQTHFGNRP